MNDDEKSIFWAYTTITMYRINYQVFIIIIIIKKYFLSTY